MGKSEIDKKSKKSPQASLTILHNVARQSRTLMARHLLETGLYAGQEQIIALLAENDTMTPGQIARALGVKPPTITKSITRLVEQGFVARSTGHQDGRQVHIQLTESGNNILKKARKAALKTEKQTFAALSDADRKQFIKSLNAISSNLDDREQKQVKKAAKKTAAQN